uniref:Uncharacterized protein n=1 Tax=Caenorhabditis japonica TaxID=281687 RepID=A0A8R1E6L3_CAEJA
MHCESEATDVSIFRDRITDNRLKACFHPAPSGRPFDGLIYASGALPLNLPFMNKYMETQIRSVEEKKGQKKNEKKKNSAILNPHNAKKI